MSGKGNWVTHACCRCSNKAHALQLDEEIR